MSKSVQAIRGMHDILPDQSSYWHHLEESIRQIMVVYGYQEIRFPVVEKTDLFVRTIGEVTDIVEKEMYSFEDRNGDGLTLRPEGTAGCVRAGIENGLLYNQKQRLWYMGPMFRHERPQKGRYRQFHQVGVEAFGMAGPDLDAELVLMTARLWKVLGLQGLELQINSLGSPQARAEYRERLVGYLSEHEDLLDADSKRRLHTNPLRILDSKNPDMRALIKDAPSLSGYLDEDSRAHFDAFKVMLDDAGVRYTVNPCLVRGLDYYQKTVFEWVSSSLGAQATVCAGGRYDGLVEQLGGKPTFAAGFAMGLERLVELLVDSGIELTAYAPQAYLVAVGDEATMIGLRLAESLRDEIAGFQLQLHCGGGSFKSQLKSADKSGARIAILLGEDEVKSEQVGIKFLREEKPQETIAISSLVEYVKKLY